MTFAIRWTLPPALVGLLLAAGCSTNSSGGPPSGTGGGNATSTGGATSGTGGTGGASAGTGGSNSPGTGGAPSASGGASAAGTGGAASGIGGASGGTGGLAGETGGNAAAAGGGAGTGGAAGGGGGQTPGGGGSKASGGGSGNGGANGNGGLPGPGTGGTTVACQGPIPVTTGAAVTVTVDLSAAATTKVSPDLMGIHTAVYDGLLTTSTTTEQLLRAAGVTSLRYPGGSYADLYHWESHTATDTPAAGAGSNTIYVAPEANFGQFVLL